MIRPGDDRGRVLLALLRNQLNEGIDGGLLDGLELLLALLNLLFLALKQIVCNEPEYALLVARFDHVDQLLERVQLCHVEVIGRVREQSQQSTIVRMLAHLSNCLVHDLTLLVLVELI